MVTSVEASCPELRLVPEKVETNLVWFEAANGPALAAALKAEGVLVSQAGPRALRACLHLDISTAQAEQAAAILRRVVSRRVAVPA